MIPPAKRHIRPPRLRTESDPDAERHATWLELFFDLVFVVAVASLAQSLIGDHSVAGFGRVVGLFLPVFVAWQGFSLYSDRFDNDDVPQRLALFAGTFAIGSLSVQMDAVAHGAGSGFALSYIALRVLTIFLYGRAFAYNPSARPLLTRYLSGYAVSVMLWGVSVFVPSPWRYVLWGVGITCDLLMPPLSARFIRDTPISTSHLSERFGLFTLLVMGESVVAVTQGVANATPGTVSFAASALGLVCAAALWWLYFDDGEDAELRPGSTAIWFAYLHIPLLLALTTIGAGVHLVIESASHNEPLGAGARVAIGAGVAVFVGSLLLIQREQVRGVRPVPVMARCVAVAVAATLTVFGAGLSPLWWIGSVAVLLAALVAVETLAP